MAGLLPAEAKVSVEGLLLMFYGIYVADAVQVGFTPRLRLGHGNAVTTTQYGTFESERVESIHDGCGYGYGACDMILIRVRERYCQTVISSLLVCRASLRWATKLIYKHISVALSSMTQPYFIQ